MTDENYQNITSTKEKIMADDEVKINPELLHDIHAIAILEPEEGEPVINLPDSLKPMILRAEQIYGEMRDHFDKECWRKAVNQAVAEFSPEPNEKLKAAAEKYKEKANSLFADNI